MDLLISVGVNCVPQDRPSQRRLLPFSAGRRVSQSKSGSGASFRIYLRRCLPSGPAVLRLPSLFSKEWRHAIGGEATD